MSIRVEHIEVPAEKVVRYFTKDYDGQPELRSWFYDSAQQMFIFSLYIKTAAPAIRSHDGEPTK